MLVLELASNIYSVKVGIALYINDANDYAHDHGYAHDYDRAHCVNRLLILAETGVTHNQSHNLVHAPFRQAHDHLEYRSHLG